MNDDGAMTIRTQTCVHSALPSQVILSGVYISHATDFPPAQLRGV
jgi:hypothetical protein